MTKFPQLDERLNGSWARQQRFARFLAVDAMLQELKRCREQITPALGKACAAFVDCRGWKRFGAARLSDHAVERYGRSAHWVRDLAAVGRGIARLPGFEQAVAGVDVRSGHGPLGRTTAARLARVATSDSLLAWLALARRVDARQFAEAVRAARGAGSAFPLGLPAEGRPATDDSPRSTSHGAADAQVDAQAEGGFGKVAGAAAGPGAGTGAGAGAGAAAGIDPDGDVDDHDGQIAVGLFLPGPLRVAFDDVLELHRAVSGGQVPVRDFVEALVAEAISGAVPADVDCFPLQPGESCRDVERRLADAAGGWSALDDAAKGPAERKRLRRSKADRELDANFVRIVTDARKTCERLKAMAGRAGVGGPAELHRQIRALLALEDPLVRSMGELLGWIGRYRACGENLFNGIGHYAEERLGMNRREAQIRAGVDRRLKRFPLLDLKQA